MTVRRRTALLILVALWIAEATGAFETAIIYAAFKALIREFHDPIKVGWLVTTFLLVGAGATAVVGRLGDVYGRRRVTLWLLAAGMTGAAISAVSTNFALLLLGRAIEGLTAAILPLVIGLVRENLPPRRVSLGIGIIVSGASAGGAAGLVIGGVIVDHFSWHTVFLASLVFAAISLALIFIWVPQSPGSRRTAPLDWLGGVLFVPAVAGLLLVISNSQSWGWLGWRPLSLLGASAALIALWVRRSLRAAEPLIDVRLFGNRQVLVANLVTALVAMSTMQITLVFSALFQAPLWTGIGLGATATIAGLAKLPSNVGAVFAGPLGGHLTGRLGGRLAMVIGGVVTTLGWLLAIALHGSIPVLASVLCVIAFGTTIMFAVGQNLLVSAVAAERTSEAAGMMGVVRQLFIAIGGQMVAVLLATRTLTGPGGAAYSTAPSFMLTMGVIAAICALATLVALALPARGNCGRGSIAAPSSPIWRVPARG